MHACWPLAPDHHKGWEPALPRTKPRQKVYKSSGEQVRTGKPGRAPRWRAREWTWRADNRRQKSDGAQGRTLLSQYFQCLGAGEKAKPSHAIVWFSAGFFLTSKLLRPNGRDAPGVCSEACTARDSIRTPEPSTIGSSRSQGMARKGLHLAAAEQTEGICLKKNGLHRGRGCAGESGECQGRPAGTGLAEGKKLSRNYRGNLPPDVPIRLPRRMRGKAGRKLG
jgi:hypothetical protein